MKIMIKTITNQTICDLEVSDSYNFSSELIINEWFVKKDKESYYKQLYTDGLIVLDAFAAFDTTLDNTLSFRDNLIALVFHLRGNSALVSVQGSSADKKHLREQVHNIEIINAEKVRLLFEPDSFTDAFIILLDKDFYLRLMPAETPIHRHLSEALKNNLNASLSARYLPVNQEMRRVIDNIRHCTRKGSFHRLCLELKIAELLMLQLEQFHLFASEQKEKPLLSICDQKKLDKAKEILDKNFHNPPTIKELSSAVGLNESKLKAAFKSSFNSTIHAYTLKLRMETAYRLITESENQIKETAMAVGYQNASHFSAAFKKFFGFNPSKT